MSISDELKKILEIAIKFEDEGIKFYTDASDKDMHPLGKAMFKSFIEEEKKHKEKLEEILSQGLDVKEEPDDTKIEDVLGKLNNLFNELYEHSENTIDPNADDLKAIRSAIDFEKDGGKIYIDAANAVNNQAEKELFTFLANEEKAHLTVLQNMHDEMEILYKQEARNEQRTQVEWERKLFMRPDAEARKWE